MRTPTDTQQTLQQLRPYLEYALAHRLNLVLWTDNDTDGDQALWENCLHIDLAAPTAPRVGQARPSPEPCR